MHPESRQGLAAAVLAFGTWAVYPLFYKQLAHLSASEVMAHRVVWSAALLLLGMLWTRRLRQAAWEFTEVKVLAQVALATLFISTNWFIFIYAVSSNRILEASLGYFLNPVVTALLGVIFLRERPDRLRAAAIVVAALGMLATFLIAGVVPVLSLTLAFSFGFYSLLRKRSPLDSAGGLFFETALIAPFALAWLSENGSAPAQLAWSDWAWLITAGAITVVPLLAVVYAAKRIELGTLGFLQYIAPSGHLLIAVIVYQEPIDLSRAIAFSSTLLAVMLFSAGAWRGWRANSRKASRRPTGRRPCALTRTPTIVHHAESA
ncbi:MAG: EamA family transporter RarD [Burkholderiaceae bacterium]